MRFVILISIVFIIAACGGKSSGVTPTSEIIQKIWITQLAKEDNNVVFNRENSSNTRQGYSQFRLNISKATVSITEFDGTTFSGQWELSADGKKITLKNLNPVPSGTTGVIEYSINSVSESKLILSRITVSPKSGNRAIYLELSPQ